MASLQPNSLPIRQIETRLIMNHRRFLVALAVLPLCLALTGWQVRAAEVIPSDLRCEHLINPLGIDPAKPRLSWELQAADAKVMGLKQTAYQVLAATSPQLLAEGKVVS